MAVAKTLPGHVRTACKQTNARAYACMHVYAEEEGWLMRVDAASHSGPNETITRKRLSVYVCACAFAHPLWGTGLVGVTLMG